jgi:hypothetical protein
MPPGQAGNGQPARMRGDPCCGWNCFGKPGEPFTPHYYVVHGKAGTPSAGGIDLGRTRERLPDSELAAARLIKQMHADAVKPLLHGEQTGRWRQWDGTRYAPLPVTAGADLAQMLAGEYKILLREIRQAVNLEVSARNPDAGADEIEEKAEAEMKAKWGKHRGYRGTLWSERGQAALIRQLGRTCGEDESLLDVGTGEIVVDGGRVSHAQILRDGVVRPLEHDPRRLVTRRMGAGVDYVPGAACPVFDEFLATSVADEAQRDWLCWRAISALFGLMPRKGFVNPIGERDSGKTTFELLMHALGGDYVITVPVRTFLAKPASDQNFLAAGLRGARMVLAAEPRPGGRYDDGYMKDITGRAPQRTADKNEKHVGWVPQCTPFILSNAPIRFATSDEAMMERQEVVRFARGYASMDGGLLDRMRGELPGILNRLLRMVIREARWGPPRLPASMVAERERLASETEDALRFIAGLLEEGRLAEAAGLPFSHYAQVDPLYRAYWDWAQHEERVRQPVGRTTFRDVVGRRYPVVRSDGKRFRGLVVRGQIV